MIKAGRIQTLTVSRTSDYGLYLADEEHNEVLLPNRYTSLADKTGDAKVVFVYHDSEDRLVATTERPLLQVGEVGALRVVDKTQHGAFLDWGLHGKDLFLPNRNQQGGVVVGHRYVVYLYEDNVTGRCVATMKLRGFIDNEVITVRPHQQVRIVVASQSEIGYRVVVENRHWGMIYNNQLFRPVAVGDALTGYVRRITEDNRIDISLQQTGYAQVKDSAQELLRILREHGGRLPLNDDSSPEEIARTVQMSKKVFKRSLGMLLRSGEVTLTEGGIETNAGHGED
jgi:predicted RNA-binding protein (virulence factor B family)